jgi:hypothetical protein
MIIRGLVLPTLTQLRTEIIIYMNYTYQIPPAYQEAMVRLATKYADEHAAGTGDFYYEKQHGGDGKKEVDKIWRSNAIGKYGECFASLCMRMFGFPDLAPDFTIYPIKQRTYAADLPYHQSYPRLPDVHVKTCDGHLAAMEFDGRKIGHSWLFQQDDPLLKYRNNDLLLLCYVPSLTEGKAQVLATLPIQKGLALLKPPRKKVLQAYKVALEYDDIHDAAGVYLSLSE